MTLSLDHPLNPAWFGFIDQRRPLPSLRGDISTPGWWCAKRPVRATVSMIITSDFQSNVAKFWSPRLIKPLESADFPTCSVFFQCHIKNSLITSTFYMFYVMINRVIKALERIVRLLWPKKVLISWLISWLISVAALRWWQMDAGCG